MVRNHGRRGANDGWLGSCVTCGGACAVRAWWMTGRLLAGHNLLRSCVMYQCLLTKDGLYPSRGSSMVFTLACTLEKTATPSGWVLMTYSDMLHRTIARTRSNARFKGSCFHFCYLVVPKSLAWSAVATLRGQASIYRYQYITNPFQPRLCSFALDVAVHSPKMYVPILVRCEVPFPWPSIGFQSARRISPRQRSPVACSKDSQLAITHR